MVRGTASQFKFSLPENFSDITLAKIIFWQPGNNNANLPIIKNLDSCYPGSNAKELCVTLNQEETMRFLDTAKAKVQIRASGRDFQPFASHEKGFTVYPLHDTTFLGENILPFEMDTEVLIDGGIIPLSSVNSRVILDGGDISLYLADNNAILDAGNVSEE